MKICNNVVNIQLNVDLIPATSTLASELTTVPIEFVAMHWYEPTWTACWLNDEIRKFPSRTSNPRRFWGTIAVPFNVHLKAAVSGWTEHVSTTLEPVRTMIDWGSDTNLGTEAVNRNEPLKSTYRNTLFSCDYFENWRKKMRNRS